MNNSDELELDLLLEAVFRKYGHDFRAYSRASMRRRIQLTADEFYLSDSFDLLRAVLASEEVFNRFAINMSVTVTEMFRDPEFYLAIREQVIPALEANPFIKVWHAGCATGEEVYSMAIAFDEAGLLERSRFYATDFNSHSLKIAREGVYSLDKMQQHTRNYLAAGGCRDFSDYYRAKYSSVMMDKRLGRNMVFSRHDLTTDGVFADFDLVVCRNVLIYFNSELQERVLHMFSQSLTDRGFLALGTSETLSQTAVADRFSSVSAPCRIYQLTEADKI